MVFPSLHYYPKSLNFSRFCCLKRLNPVKQVKNIFQTSSLLPQKLQTVFLIEYVHLFFKWFQSLIMIVILSTAFGVKAETDC